VTETNEVIELPETNDVIELRPTPAPVLGWLEQGAKEVVALEAAAQASPKAFFGNRVLGMGEGLARVKALLPAVKSLERALDRLNRGL
jgi:hypothetical protein